MPFSTKIVQEREGKMCNLDEIDKSESDDDSHEERESHSCFMVISNENLLNSELDNCIDENDVPSYDELLHAPNDLVKT